MGTGRAGRTKQDDCPASGLFFPSLRELVDSHPDELVVGREVVVGDGCALVVQVDQAHHVRDEASVVRVSASVSDGRHPACRDGCSEEVDVASGMLDVLDSVCVLLDHLVHLLGIPSSGLLPHALLEVEELPLVLPSRSPFD
jgi:hypothetical protein